MSEETYSVGELSALAGISVRTLHYYDEVELLVPSRHGDNSYRVYHEDHLISLQQILIYRELGFSISEIKALLQADDFNLLSALEQQKSMLLQRRSETDSMLNSIEASMSKLNGKLNQEILFDGIPDDKKQRWGKMARAQIGGEAVAQWQQSLGKLSDAQALDHKQRGDEFFEKYAQALDKPIDSESVQTLVLQHYQLMNEYLYLTQENFSGISDKGFVVFAKSYVENPLAKEIYEHYGIGLSEHLSKAMIHFSAAELSENLPRYRLFGSQ